MTLARAHALALLLAIAGGCRGRGGDAADAGARVTPSTSTSTTTPAIAPAAMITGEPTAKLDPPPGPSPKAHAPTVRLPLLTTETAGSYDVIGGVRVLDRFGIAGRIANARIVFYGLAPIRRTENSNEQTNVLCETGVVTERVLSGSCTRVRIFNPPPGSRAPGGPIGGSIEVVNLEFLEEEGPPVPITLAGLFRPEVDARTLVQEACKKAYVADEDPAAFSNPGTDKAPQCTVGTFELTARGLYLMWSDDAELDPRFTHRATVPWRSFGKKLRPDGAACSFVWKEDDVDDDADAGAEDPCR